MTTLTRVPHLLYPLSPLVYGNSSMPYPVPVSPYYCTVYRLQFTVYGYRLRVTVYGLPATATDYRVRLPSTGYGLRFTGQEPNLTRSFLDESRTTNDGSVSSRRPFMHLTYRLPFTVRIMVYSTDYGLPYGLWVTVWFIVRIIVRIMGYSMEAHSTGFAQWRYGWLKGDLWVTYG